MKKILLFLQVTLAVSVYTQERVGKLTEVYAWKQLTFNINGNILQRDRASSDGLESTRFRRQYGSIYFADNDGDERDWKMRYSASQYNHQMSQSRYNSTNNRIDTPTRNLNNNDDSSSFFIQYNNVPMGTERVGDRLFISIPRRRYGIPATLNYVDLRMDTGRSPSLRPYPSLRESQSLTSVYRTRADECGRLWMVDTGLMEIPDNPQQVQTPAIVVFDLRNDRQILRYQLKNSDVPANNTPTGLASITIDTSGGCSNAFAYIPDLTTFGLVVYSLQENDSWRVTHNYMHFNPLATNLRIAGQQFQWSDGIFSIVLGGGGSCGPAYFHPLISTQEFSVPICILNNRTAASDGDYWKSYSIVGERGMNAQSTMHDIHRSSGVIFFADIGRDAVSCWNSNAALNPRNVAVLASDQTKLSYPADLHVTGDEVWVITNALPRFGYSTLDTDEYNFFIYKGNVQDMISGTVCAGRSSQPMASHSHSYNKHRYRK